MKGNDIVTTVGANQWAYVWAAYGLTFLLTIIALVWGSASARRQRIGAPGALGTPYVRGERG